MNTRTTPKKISARFYSIKQITLRTNKAPRSPWAKQLHPRVSPGETAAFGRGSGEGCGPGGEPDRLAEPDRPWPDLFPPPSPVCRWSVLLEGGPSHRAAGVSPERTQSSIAIPCVTVTRTEINQ